MRLSVRTKIYVFTHPLALTISFFAILSGIVVFLLPEMQRVALNVYLPGALWYLWPLVHLTGGFLAALGVLRLLPRFEAAGMTLLAFTFMGQAVSVLEVREFTASAVTVLTFFSLAVGCGGRALLLVTWRGHGY